MKNILFAAAALSALAAAPAMAQTTSTVTLTGNVNAACSFTSQNGTVPLSNIATGVGALNAAAVNINLGPIASEVTCNGAGTTVSVNANPLQGSVAVPNGAPAAFTNIVNFTATVSLPGYTSGGVATIANATTAPAATSAVVGLMQSGGSLALSGAALPDGASVLIASNTYSGSVAVTIAPGI